MGPGVGRLVGSAEGIKLGFTLGWREGLLDEVIVGHELGRCEGHGVSLSPKYAFESILFPSSLLFKR